MCFSKSSAPLCALLQLLLVTSSTISRVSAATPQDDGDNAIPQKHLQWTGCLPGPLVHASIPTCVTLAASGLDRDHDKLLPPADTAGPWAYAPFCADPTPYCAFTSTAFQSRGVSVITAKPSNSTSALSLIASIVSSRFPPPIRLPSGNPPYEVREIKNKGLGVVATRKIPRGSKFMLDYAMVLADMEMPSKLRMAQGRELVRRAMDRLPDPEKVLGLARSSLTPDKTPAAEDVLRTNAFEVELGGKRFMGLFPDIARINHACKPSAMTKFNATDLSNTVTAFRDILPGEEITISYTAYNLPSSDRRPRLEAQWGFKCTCDLCSSPASELAASDARRRKIDQVGPRVLRAVDKGDFEAAIRLNRDLIDTIREEGMMPHMGDYYEIMGRLYLAWAKTREARTWFNRALGEYKAAGVTEGVEKLEGVIRQLSGAN